MEQQQLTKLARQLLSPLGLRLDTMTALSGGGNNRAFRLTLSDASALFLKLYFKHPDDPRDRLGTEYAFLQYAAKVNAPTPRPIAESSEHNFAVYEFVEGRKLKSEEVTEKHINAAVNFITQLNSQRDTELAKALPDASESCFSIAQHIALVERRVQRLQNIPGQEPIDSDARDFVSAQLLPTWQLVRTRIAAQYSATDMDTTLPPQQRVISPSDFGFHNALLAPSGTLTFIDFEYAGWDDPAKLICDFFCQPAVPVDKQHFPEFAARILAKDVAALKRSECLLPAYKIKWCCIMLNEFLPASAARRSFAGSEAPDRKRQQLRRASQLLGILK